MPEKYKFIDAEGHLQDLELGVEHYRMAADAQMSLRQMVNLNYPTASKDSTTFDQVCASAGLFIRSDPNIGVRPPTMKQVMEGGVKISAGSIIRPDGSGNNTPSGRLLFPEVVLNVIESELRASNDMFLSGLDSMVALDTSVTSPRVEQPIINVKAPEGSRSQPIAQLAEPVNMVTITVSDTTFKIPTKAISLTIADEAAEAATLDLVGITMTAQARGEKIAEAEDMLSGMINGDVDRGETALVGVKANTFDSDITVAGDLTHKAWVKWLWTDFKKRSLNWALCDIDTALAIQSRSGKPTVQDDDPQSERIGNTVVVDNFGLGDIRLLPVDTSVIGANTIVGLDSNFAIQRITNVNASYSAIEQYVMRRATSFRVDFGFTMRKLFPDAWSVMTLTI